MTIRKGRLLLVAVSLSYVFVNIYCYYFYLTPVWGYQGFPEFDIQRSLGPLLFATFCCLGFAAIFPRIILSYSRFVSWFIFFFIFVPSVVIVAMQGFPEDGGYLLIACLTISLIFIAYIPESSDQLLQHYADDNNLHAHFLRRLKKWGERISITKTEINLVLLIGCVALVLMALYSDVLRLVSLTNVYDQREIVSEYSPNRTLAAYLTQWLVRVIAPFMVAAGLIFGRKLLLYAGLVGFFIGFLITASKFIAFSIPLMFGFHYFILDRKSILAERFAVFFATTMVVVLALIKIYGKEVESFIGLILSQVIKRAFSINGMTLGNYYDFFINNSNPFTLYTHLGPVSWIAEYPYESYSIGQVVGYFQVGLYSYDMSAGFWSTDGIAAAGYFGVVLIGVMLGGILAVFNQWCHATNLRLICLSSLGCVWMLADTSVFRVMLSGGWPLHFLLAYLICRAYRFSLSARVISLGKLT